jgi:hypothetical protein
MGAFLQRSMRMILYTVVLLTVMIIGFSLAMRGMEALVGTNRPPLPLAAHGSLSHEKLPEIRGKVNQKVSLPIGVQWSRQLEKSHSGVADAVDALTLRIGRGIQDSVRRGIQIVAGKMPSASRHE